MPHTLYKLDVLTSPTSKRWIKSWLIIFLKVGPKLREISTPTQPDLLPSLVKMQTTHKTYGLLPPCEVLSPLAELGGGWWTSGWSSFTISAMWVPLIPKLPLSKPQKLANKKRRGEAKKKYITEEGWFSPKEVNIPTLKLPRKVSLMAGNEESWMGLWFREGDIFSVLSGFQGCWDQSYVLV